MGNWFEDGLSYTAGGATLLTATGAAMSGLTKLATYGSMGAVAAAVLPAACLPVAALGGAGIGYGLGRLFLHDLVANSLFAGSYPYLSNVTRRNLYSQEIPRLNLGALDLYNQYRDSGGMEPFSTFTKGFPGSSNPIIIHQNLSDIAENINDAIGSLRQLNTKYSDALTFNDAIPPSINTGPYFQMDPPGECYDPVFRVQDPGFSPALSSPPIPSPNSYDWGLMPAAVNNYGRYAPWANFDPFYGLTMPNGAVFNQGNILPAQMQQDEGMYCAVPLQGFTPISLGDPLSSARMGFSDFSTMMSSSSPSFQSQWTPNNLFSTPQYSSSALASPFSTSISSYPSISLQTSPSLGSSMNSFNYNPFQSMSGPSSNFGMGGGYQSWSGVGSISGPMNSAPGMRSFGM